MFLGNLPIYKNINDATGSHQATGCEYVINFKINDNNTCSLIFTEQDNIVLVDSNTSKSYIIDLDISNLVRLLTLLNRDCFNNPINIGYILIGTSKTIALLNYQNTAYVKTSQNKIELSILKEKEKKEFIIESDFQKQCFINTLKEIQKIINNKTTEQFTIATGSGSIHNIDPGIMLFENQINSTEEQCVNKYASAPQAL